jgi:2-dehydropantoate 2-reductase
MQITVFGAGSIGSLFAGRIAYSGFDISVVGRQPHVREICKNGLRIIEDRQQLISHFPASPVFQPEVITPEAVFVTTKAYDNDIVASSMAGKLSEDTPILLLQNGMGNSTVFRQKFPNNPLFRAVTTEAAELVYPGVVKHVSFGRTTFDLIAGDENGFSAEIQEVGKKSGFQVKKAKDIQLSLWQKLLTNATICPLAAILHVPNGKILDKPSIQQIFDAILEEGLTLASCVLPDEDFSVTRDYILRVIDKTKNNRCSMLQDIERGRRTEIDYLNGFIVEESRRLGLNAPVNAAITDLVRHLENYPQ